MEQDLDKLREKLVQSQRAQQTAEIDIRQGGARITALQTLIAEFNTIIARYRERYQQLKDKQENLKEHCDKEKSCFIANLGDVLSKKIKDLSDQVMSA